KYDLYLSFTGGPTLDLIERRFGSPAARVLYCSADPAIYYPEKTKPHWDLGYLGTYSADRQPALDCLMLEPARRWTAGRFVVAGPMYPEQIEWPANVQRIEHLPPTEHRSFYTQQRFTLNITRADMIAAGYSPSVRLFEAAACGTPIISDHWPGLESLFEPGKEILIASSPEQTLHYLHDFSRTQMQIIGERARQRVIAEHTPEHRALQLESYVCEARLKGDFAQRRNAALYIG